MHYGAHKLAPAGYYERLRKEKAKQKPRLTQKHGGWVCTGVHPYTGGIVVRWRETPEDAYAEYLKACKEEMTGTIDPVLFSGKGAGNVEAVDYTRPAYSSYDIYENAEEQDKKNEKILWCYMGVLGLLVVAMFVGIALS